MMDEFEPTLSLLHKSGMKRYGDDWLPRLEKRRVKLEGAYATLYETDRDPIPYISLSAQTAYVFAYAPARAEYTRQFLHRHRNAYGEPLFTRQNVEVVSFGGGPASELVGLVRYLESPDTGEPVESIAYTIYDKDGAWATTAEHIVSSLETDIAVELRYEEADVASRAKMADIDLTDTDLVIFSYVMSELAKVGTKDEIAENFRNTLRNMKVTSKILFIDNLHPLFIDFFRSCKLVTGLVQKNDDGEPVDSDFPDMRDTFATLSKNLSWFPRTDLRTVSKLIVRTRR
jgi:hypothetical protein